MSTTMTERTKLEEKIASNKSFTEKMKTKLASVEEEYVRTKDCGSGAWIECTQQLLKTQDEHLQNLIKRLELIGYEPVLGTLSLCHAPAGDGWSATQVNDGVVWRRT